MSIREGRQANNQFVDIEKWQAAVTELGVVRWRMSAACDAADSASCQAGTPIRTQSRREQIDAVSSEIDVVDHFKSDRSHCLKILRRLSSASGYNERV